MVAIIGGGPRRFRPLENGQAAGYAVDRLKLGVHAGYVAETTQDAADGVFPGFARAVTDVGGAWLAGGLAASREAHESHRNDWHARRALGPRILIQIGQRP
jgi:hypothetical protein